MTRLDTAPSYADLYARVGRGETVLCRKPPDAPVGSYGEGAGVYRHWLENGRLRYRLEEPEKESKIFRVSR